jgi:integrase
LRRSFTTTCRRTGIRDFRIHDLRHTCASLVISEGVPLASIRDLLGHSSVTVTERYAHLKPEAVREAVAVLDRLQSHSGHIGSEVNAASNVVTLVKS